MARPGVERFDKYLDTTSKDKARTQFATGRYAVVMSYDPYQNTATIMLSSENSASMAGLIKNVPCPVQLGVQTAGPRPGRECWVQFKGTDGAHPVITHFFNYNYNTFDHPARTASSNGMPRFSLTM